MKAPWHPRLSRPWLIADLGAPHRVLSFAPYRGGFSMARKILWREVRNRDLAPDRDALAWLSQEMRARLRARGWVFDLARYWAGAGRRCAC